MTPTEIAETAEQLELAARIKRENLEWEYQCKDWYDGAGDITEALIKGYKIRIKPTPEVKTLGQVAFEAFRMVGTEKWSSSLFKGEWERTVKAVVAEHEKRKAANQTSTIDYHTEEKTYRDLTPGVDVWQEGDEWGSKKVEDFDKIPANMIGEVFGGYCKGRRPITSEPELVNLEPEDVPPGSCLRAKGQSVWFIIFSVSDEGIAILGRTGHIPVTWQNAFAGWEILLPNTTEWLPCSKPKGGKLG